MCECVFKTIFQHIVKWLSNIYIKQSSAEDITVKGSCWRLPATQQWCPGNWGHHVVDIWETPMMYGYSNKVVWQIY